MKSKEHNPQTPVTSPGTTGSASQAMQEIQLGVLLMIWSNVTTSGFLKVACALVGAAYMVGGAIRSIRG